MEQSLIQLSKTISRALRHAPWEYELELDPEGWVELEDLLDSLRRERSAWHSIGPATLDRIIAESDKQRFEVRDGRIRAFYGHSVPQKMLKQPASPPEILFHGTSERTAPIIQANGLRPMRRQYVHLSADHATALQVARRKGGHSVLLRVKAGDAHRKGVTFYLGNEMVWLADFVPPEYLEVSDYH